MKIKTNPMNWMKFFSKNQIDEDILELYLDIELLIKEINSLLSVYLKYLFAANYYKSNPKNKAFYSIQKINYFMKKMKESYGYCYTLRSNKKHYNFQKNNKTKAKKDRIVFFLKNIINILNDIYKIVKQLDYVHFKNNDFSLLIKKVEFFVENEKLFEKLKKHDEHIITNIIDQIIFEANKNEEDGVWLISQKDKQTRLYFSNNLSLSYIKYLELVPLLELKKLEKRSLFINELHKDKTLPIYHYNLKINNKNIHVIPKNYKSRVECYLRLA